MANKWTQKLNKMEGALTTRFDPFASSNLLRSPSPSVNWLFGKTHGLPFGYSVLLWGEPKAGKSLLANAIIGQLHRDYPDAIAVKFDTEMRDEGQMNEESAKTFGIDLDRYVVFQVNGPGQVFDRIQQDINALIQDGAPVKLIVIDSITGIQGRREADSESVEKYQIGDHAQTVQIGLKRILPVQRQNKIAMILTAHARAELDMWEQKRGNKSKAAAAFGVRHHCEYFINVERNRTAAGQKDALERKFEDTTRKDLVDEAEQTGHKIRVWMQDSTVGPQNRMAEFSIDYKRGIINQYEEVFRLGTSWNVIGRPSPAVYTIDNEKFHGKPACLGALEKSPELQQKVIQGLMAMEKTQSVISNITSQNENIDKEFETVSGDDTGAE